MEEGNGWRRSRRAAPGLDVRRPWRGGIGWRRSRRRRSRARCAAARKGAAAADGRVVPLPGSICGGRKGTSAADGHGDATRAPGPDGQHVLGGPAAAAASPTLRRCHEGRGGGASHADADEAVTAGLERRATAGPRCGGCWRCQARRDRTRPTLMRTRPSRPLPCSRYAAPSHGGCGMSPAERRPIPSSRVQPFL